MTEPSRAPYRCEASGMGFDPTTQTLLASPRVYRLWNHVNPTIHASVAFHSPIKGLVSVALVLLLIYLIYSAVTGVTRMAFRRPVDRSTKLRSRITLR